MKFKAFFLIIFMAISQLSLSQIDIGRKLRPGYVLGVQIDIGWYGMVSYYEAFYTGVRLINYKSLTKNVFWAKMTGQMGSPANPLDTNLFIYYQIRNPYVIDSLWKLRYAVYPYKKNSPDTIGWTMNFANPFHPTHKQKQILYSLGMDTTYYIIFGENFYNLLKLMNDPHWVENYKNAR